MVEPLQPQRLPQAQALINAHLSALAPGWSIPEAFITSRIHHDPGEYIVGPWVIAGGLSPLRICYATAQALK
jgi:hypothetical protein